MNDLISRKQALEEMTFSDGIEKDGVLYVPLRDVNNHLRNLPSTQPTAVLCNELRISTLPKIVMCKDCRFRIDGNCYVSNFKDGLPCMIRWVKGNDYCSMGERKTDE